MDIGISSPQLIIEMVPPALIHHPSLSTYPSNKIFILKGGFEMNVDISPKLSTYFLSSTLIPQHPPSITSFYQGSLVSLYLSQQNAQNPPASTPPNKILHPISFTLVSLSLYHSYPS